MRDDDYTGQRVGMYCRVSTRKFGAKDPDEREKSTEDQEAIGRRWVEQHGADLVGVYIDDGISASRFSKKERKEWNRLTLDIEDDKLDMLWFWEQSRLTRRPGQFFDLMDLCIDHEVLLVNQDRVIDPSDYKEMLAPQVMSIVDSMSSHQTSERVRRGMASIAAEGRPTGKVPYGYHRVSAPDGSKHQEPKYFDDEGRPVEDSPASVVRELFERIAAGDSLRTIAHDFEARGIRSPGGVKRWHYPTLRGLALNPRYIGQRVHQGEVLDGVEATWPPLVTEDLFWRVNEIMQAEGRGVVRPSRAKTLLTYLLRCGKCGGKMQYLGARHPYRGPRGRSWPRNPTYGCTHRACVGINVELIDPFVERTMIDWLSDPDVYSALTAVDDTAAATQARAEASRAKVELEKWRRAAEAGDVDASGYTRATKGLLDRIKDAEQRAQSASVPLPLAGRLGENAEASWNRASLEVKRQMIQAAADITVLPVGSGVRVPIRDRVSWRWLLGPDAGETRTSSRPIVRVNQARVLKVLADHNGEAPVLQRHLPGLLNMSQHAACAPLPQMVEHGWIERRPVPNRRGPGQRDLALTLTDAGREVAAALADSNGSGVRS